jgi:histidinol phosphatase-like enzyme (inositol monophosphatase family)
MPESLDPARIETLEALLIELNAVSAEAILPLFRADHGLENKAGGGLFDPVTEADKGGEAAIRALVSKRFPEHGFIGEEYGEERAAAEFVWVLDPIDGTRAFIAGLPVWTTLIGLRFQGEPLLGSIGQPYLGEIFLGGPTGARFMARGQTRPMRVRPCPLLTDAIIGTTDPALFDGAERGAWDQVHAAAKLARLGCDSYAYAMVAMGKMDLVVETNLKPWDIEGAIPLIEGAGGVVANWRGDPVGPMAGQVAIAGDRACLDEALVALRRSSR